MENNIIDVKLTKTHGKIDMTCLEEYVEMSGMHTAFCVSFLKSVRTSVYNVVNEAGLQDLDFSLRNAMEIIDAARTMELNISPIELVAVNGDYVYALTVVAGFEDDLSIFDCTPEDEIPYCLTLTLTRHDNDMNSWVFNTQNKKWETLNIEEYLHITKAQKEMLEEDDPRNAWKADLLMDYVSEFGKLSDEEFDKLIKRNQKILTLQRMTDRFTEAVFTGNGSWVAIEMYNYDGARVIYKNGSFILQACVQNEVMKDVYSTENLQEMEAVMKRIFDHFYKNENIVAVVPLACDAYAVIMENGTSYPYIISPRKGGLTKAESQLMRKCARLCTEEFSQI